MKTSLIRTLKEEEFLEEALIKGRVWLSSINKCKKHEDSRGDKTEGFRDLEIFNNNKALEFNKENSKKLFGIAYENVTIKGTLIKKIPFNTFIFCASLSNPPHKHVKGHGNFSFEITNPDLFETLISDYLWQEYLNKKILLFDDAIEIGTRKEKVTYNKQPRVIGDEKEALRAVNILDLDDLYCKPSNYKEENEFRFAWYFIKKILGPKSFSVLSIKDQEHFVVEIAELKKIIRKIIH